MAKLQCTCETCGSPFMRKPSDIARGRSRFCSYACRNVAQKRPLAERFAEFVGAATETGCVLWVGMTDRQGYGKIGQGGEYGPMLIAHRVAWELAHGPIPDGLCVLHNCPGGDNPSCVNVAHLWLGTRTDNAADMVAKGRQARGERLRQAKLAAAQVRSILRHV